MQVERGAAGELLAGGGVDEGGGVEDGGGVELDDGGEDGTDATGTLGVELLGAEAEPDG